MTPLDRVTRPAPARRAAAASSASWRTVSPAGSAVVDEADRLAAHTDRASVPAWCTSVFGEADAKRRITSPPSRVASASHLPGLRPGGGRPASSHVSIVLLRSVRWGAFGQPPSKTLEWTVDMFVGRREQVAVAAVGRRLEGHDESGPEPARGAVERRKPSARVHPRSPPRRCASTRHGTTPGRAPGRQLDDRRAHGPTQRPERQIPQGIRVGSRKLR